MAKLYQNNFVGGEISPSLYARSDLAAYYKGCAKAENFLVTKEGSLRKRNGIRSFLQLSAITDPSQVKIVPYKYDRFGGGFLLLTVSGTTLTVNYYKKDGTSYTLSSSITVASFTGALAEIQNKQIGDQVWLVNGSWYKVITVTDNTTIAASDWSKSDKPSAVESITAAGYNSDGNAWNPSSGRTITYCAYIVKNGVLSDSKTVNKFWSTSWNAGYYIEVTITLPDDIFSAKDFDYVIIGKKVGALFGELGRWYPEDFTSASVVYKDENVSAADVIYPQTDTLGEGWSNPLCLDCFQQRKVYANASTSSGSLPMTLWFSAVGNINNFYANRPAADDDAFSPTIMSTGPAFIRHLAVYQETMIALTDCGLFSISCSQTQGFSSTSCRINRFSDIAPAPSIQPVVTSAGLVFVGADQKTLYTCTFDIQDNALKPINRTVLVEHLTRKAKITSIALAQYPQNVIYATLSDGTFATFTFERDEEVYAWSSHRLCVDEATMLQVVAPGCCTEVTDDRTYTDLVFFVEQGGNYYLAQLDPTQMKDKVGDIENNITATLITLRPEMQDRTIVGVPKNIHDVLIRVFETGGLKVRTANGALDAVVYPTSTDDFTGDIKLMPRGYFNDYGQLEIISDDAHTAEILAVCQKLEIGN